jgi:hypothetical protein
MTPMSAGTTTLDELSPRTPLRARIWGAMRRAWERIAAYVARRRNEWIAAALYQELSKLSDVELERRGIARGDLHRHLSEN